MAMSGFKSFGWILGLATVSPACYMVSSMVAAERGRVEGVERAIIEAHRDIRRLETEFETRANIAQLERWNGEVLALAAPRPDQFLPGAAALASFRPGASGERAEMAMVMPVGLPDASVPEAVPTPAVATVAAPVAPAVQRSRPVVAVSAPAPVAAAVASVERTKALPKPRVQKVAMLDNNLLSDSTLGELAKRAGRESKSR